MSISRIASQSSAATVRAAPRKRAGWRGTGRRKPAAGCAQSSVAGAGALAGARLSRPHRQGARAGKRGDFLLANGRGVTLDPAQALAREPFLAVAEIAGSAGAGPHSARGANLDETELEARFEDRIVDAIETSFDEKAMAVRSRAVRKLGALWLEDHPRPVEAGEATARMLAEGIARGGFERLPWSGGARQWLDRVRFMRRIEGEPWPDLSETALKNSVAEWLAPALHSKTSLGEIRADDLARALRALLSRELERRLDQEAPVYFKAPTGWDLLIDYAAEGGPALAVRVQELFGLDRHPSLGNGRVPLTLSLLSPAQRPIQVTKDLPAFWRGSWAEVRRELRGRYPKHPWPENPLAAAPTRRAKPRPKR